MNRTQCPRTTLGSRCVSRCDGYHKKALLPRRRALPRYPPLDPCTTLALLGELQPLARQFFVAPVALLVPAVRGLPAFCRMRADAFGPHIEMAAQTERSRLVEQQSSDNSHRLSKKLHSLPSSIRRIIQTRGYSCNGPTAKPPFGSGFPLSDRFHADAHPPGK